MSDEQQPSGPDLTEGIRASELADGNMLAGRVGNDAVVLARKGDEYFAFSAHCTHYNGPLAEGRLDGETIHCPWHHACFSIRTGSNECAPAPRALKIFATTRDGDLVRVGGEVTPPGPEVTTDSRHIAIAGAGAAGWFAAQELRRLGFGGRVTLLTRDERPPFDKPNLSKDYLAGRAPAEWIPLREVSEYAAENIELRLGVSVDKIDGNTLYLAGGETISFDRLILATGSSPRKLDIPAAMPIHYLRTWSDADDLRAAAAKASKAVVIGSSFIGLETAASLRERGLDVTVIGADDRPLEKVLGREVGQFIRGVHEEHGVRFRLGRKPVEVREDEVVLDDGSTESCDLVVAGIGVVPETGLAERAGLKVDRGVVVDELLQTSAPDIFAAGDIARFQSIRVEHWVVAGRQGQIAARNAMGRRERYDGVPFFWSQHYDLVFAYVGHAERADNVELFGSLAEHNAAAIYREDGRVTAVVTLYRDDVSLAVEAAMQRKESDEAILGIVRDAFK